MANDTLLPDINKTLFYGGTYEANDTPAPISIDIDQMVHPSEDAAKEDDEFYNQDKAIVDKNLETHEEILADDQDGNGDPEILDNNLSFHHTYYRKFQIAKADLMRQLDLLDNALQYNLTRRNVPGQEGLLDIIKNILTGIVNIFGHFLNLFKTGILYGLRNFKRGELKDYSDSNRFTMTRLYAESNYLSLISFEIDIPQGMKGTYKNALDSIDSFLNNLGMLERVKRMKEISENILTTVKKANPSFSAHIYRGLQEFNSANLFTEFNKIGKVFTNSRNARAIYGDCFAHAAEYEAACKQCMDGDAYLRGVGSIHSYLEDVNDNFTSLLNYASGLRPNELKDLSKIVRYFAETFDMYATVIQDRVRIDHNLTEVTKRVRKRLHM